MPPIVRMRITVVRSEGVPDGCLLSVKAGDQRRQMPLSSEGQSLSLDWSQVKGAQSLRLDLLDTLASYCTEDMQAGEHEFKFEPTRPDDPRAMSLVLRMEPAAGKLTNGSTRAVSKEGSAIAKAFGGLGRESKISNEAQSYLQSHDLLRCMRSGLSRVLRERPAEPRAVLAEEILRPAQHRPPAIPTGIGIPGAGPGLTRSVTNLCPKPDSASRGRRDARPGSATGGVANKDARAGNASAVRLPFAPREDASPGTGASAVTQLPAAGASPAADASPAAGTSAVTQLPATGSSVDTPGALRKMDFLSVPHCPSNLPLRVLDLGSNEIGFYSYGDHGVTQLGGKMKASFMEDLVLPGKSEEFADELVKRYGIRAEGAFPPCGEKLTFVAGATGVNRECLQQRQEERENARKFICHVEACLATRLHRPCRIKLFVPSGQLEAQYELRAVEWLLDQVAKCASSTSTTAPSLSSDAALVGRSTLTGTISAGGGSSQLSIRRGAEDVQLFSVPLGNRKPMSDKMFSSPPKAEEVDAWASRFRTALGKADFPSSLGGLFVGISATFYAAKEAGCADCVVSKAEAISALTARINACTAGGDGEPDAAMAKSAANVTLVRELIDWVLASDARILFRRNWTVRGDVAAATWTLGYFAEAESLSMRAAALESLRPDDAPGSPTSPLSSSGGRMRKVFASTSVAIKYKDRWKKYVNKVADRREKHDRLRDSGRIIFSVPLVIRGNGPSLLLDINKDRIGFYALSIDKEHKKLVAHVASVLKCSFCDSFIATGAADRFAAEVTARFALELGGDSLAIAAGATGDFRTRLSADPELRDTLAAFLACVEGRLAQRLNRSVRVDVFVPSTDLVAKLELSAIEWMLSTLHAESGLAKKLESFMGTFAVNKTHLRLTMRPPSGSACHSLQTYTTEIHAGMSMEELHRTLHTSDFPRSLRGVYLVTTEHACALAEAAGIAGAPIAVGRAVDALLRRAEDPDADNEMQHLGGSAMLNFLATLLTWSLERKGATVVFRHSWIVGEAQGCAPLWALGLLTTQSEDEELAMSMAAARVSALPEYGDAREALLTPTAHQKSVGDD